LESSGFTIDKEKSLEKWKSILDSLNLTDEDKRNWVTEYVQKNFNYPILDGDDFVPPEDNLKNNIKDVNLLPMAMKIAAQTIGVDLVAVKPMSGPSLAGTPELNEEKYINERRKNVLEDIFGETDDLDFDKLDEIKDTDFDKLDKLKDEFMEPGKNGLLFLDFNYGNDKKNKNDK